VKCIYIEAQRVILPSTHGWCAEMTDVNHTVIRPEFGGYIGYFSAALWPCYFHFAGKEISVTFVSNHVFTREEALKIADDIVKGKVRQTYIDLSLI